MSLFPPALWVCALGAAQAGSVPAHDPKTPTPIEDGVRPYPLVTETRRSVTNFNVEVFRGVVLDPDGQDFFALSATASLLLRFAPPLPRPVEIWPTVHQPVALAWHEGDLLVVGGGTHALVRHSAVDGAVLALCPLASEPADIVVCEDQDVAWVSCQGADAVLEIDLVTFTEIRRYDVGVKRPGFLWLDTGEVGVDDSIVYVAPMISGNNTLVTLKPDGAKIRNGQNTVVYPAGGLPDVDLLRIDPRAPLDQAVTPIVRGAGSILTAHGRNPQSGEYWMLGIEEDNANPAKADEPSLQGDFATNVLALAALPPKGGAPVVPTTIDLDDADENLPGGQYDPSDVAPASFPYALAFTSGGLGLVAASTSDRVTMVDEFGVRRTDFDLPPGSIPRHIALAPDDSRFSVYCQGTNLIHLFSLAPLNTTPIATFDLGDDPLPAAVRAGRELWYDADRSANGRLSCNTCHPRGGADGIGWELSDPVLDVKDAMVTQSLFGIEDTFPYHWRGERDLRAFNGAFVGLLGADAALDDSAGSELDQLAEFVFSLQQPANPIASLHRRVENAIANQVRPNGLVGQAVDAVDDYLSFGGPNRGAVCNDCHALPTGSLGDIRPQPIFSSQIASEASTEIPHFENFALRHQPIVDVETNQGTIQTPLLGFGFAHDGVRRSAFDFIDFIAILDDQQVANMAAFVEQYDHGIAPAAHAAWLMDAPGWFAAQAAVRDVLIKQADRGWIDVAAFGTFVAGEELRTLGWVYDATTRRFVPDDPSVGPRVLADFVAQAKAGVSANVFLGVPPGNGRRLGIDRDHDGLPAGVEASLGTDPFDSDTDDDGDPDGHEVRNAGDPLDASVLSSDTDDPQLASSPELSFANARQAKFFVETNEPVQLEVQYSTPGAAPHSQVGLTFDTVHTLVLRDLEPSTAGLKTNTFGGVLSLVDLAGNRTNLPLPTFDAASMFVDGAPQHSVVGELAVESIDFPAAGTADVVLRVRVDQKEGGPPAIPLAGRVVVMQIAKRDPATGVLAISSDTSSALPASFALNGTPYVDLAGPFLVSAPTDAAGETTVGFTESGLVPSHEVVCNIVAVIEVTNPATYDPANPDFVQPKPMQQYQMPATPPELRRITLFF